MDAEKYPVIIFIVLMLLSMVMVLPSFAEEPRSEAVEKCILISDEGTGNHNALPGRDYWKGYLTDGRHVLASPFRWKGRDWIIVSLATGTTLYLYANDENVHSWFQDSRTEATDGIAGIVENFGNGLVVVPSLGALYAYSYLTGNERIGKNVLIGLESYVMSGLIANVIKFTGHRHRPGAHDGAYEWDGPGFSVDNLSFPSGHATAAFAVASVISSEYDETISIPLIAYSIASLSALSRINDDKHWASDVFFGSVIGYFTGKTIYNLHNHEDMNLSIVPLIDGNTSMIIAIYRF